MADTLGPKGKVSVPCCSQISKGYLTRTPGVKQASYGSLEHVHMELGNSQTASPAEVGRENASVQERGRRRRSNRTLSCNGEDKVKVRQGKTLDERKNGRSEESR